MKTLKSCFIFSIAGMGFAVGGLSGPLGYTSILVAIGFGVCIGGIFRAIGILNAKIDASITAPTNEE